MIIDDELKKITNRLCAKFLEALKDSPDEAKYPAAVLMSASIITRGAIESYLETFDLEKDERESFIHGMFEVFAFSILNPTNNFFIEEFGEGINFSDYWLSFLGNLKKLRENFS